MPSAPETAPKPVNAVPIVPPPADQLRGRGAAFAAEGERRNRYHLPKGLKSSSPVGYRTRLSLSRDEAEAALTLLSMPRPTAFADAGPIPEQALFEESALGIMTARQSTNFRGHEQATLGPTDSAQVAQLLRQLKGLEAPALDGAAYTHLIFSRPYRTPFTLLLTFIGHAPVASAITVPIRAWRKRFQHADDIPTIGYLQHLHVGVLADAMERATVVASAGRRRAQVFMAPFCGATAQENKAIIQQLEDLGGMSPAQRSVGWRLALVVQVGGAVDGEAVPLGPALSRRLGANLMALRSERIQPGVNHEEKSPEAYRERQAMDVPDELTVMAGRAAYNAFTHWTGCDRERAKDLLLLERIDVLTPGGKGRLRQLREMLNGVTDRVVANIPLWADLPTGKALTRNAARGRKAFALVGQRIYVGGLSRREIEAEGLAWDLAVRAFGAAASRSALVAEICGCIDIPEGCDLLAGICLMAGPVNQNDIGKAFYGGKDILAQPFPDKDPTSLLVWTLKAKTVADPIGNEEQLLNADRKGALVDLRAGPHELVRLKVGGSFTPMRSEGGRVNDERAFGDQGNFVTDAAGEHIPGNRGEAWPEGLARAPVWG